MLNSLQKMMALGFLLLANSTLVACSVDTVSSKDVESEAIYQNYNADYYESSDSTRYWAQFRVGGWTGTTVQIDPPSKLQVNGLNMSGSNFLGTSYAQATPGLATTTDFTWTDKDGHVYENATTITPITLVSAPATVSVSAPYIVTLTGAPLGAGDTVDASLHQTVGNTSVTVYGVYNSGNGTVLFASSQLAQLYNGVATLDISRTHSAALADATAEGGSISGTYHLRSVGVMVNGSILVLATK